MNYFTYIYIPQVECKRRMWVFLSHTLFSLSDRIYMQKCHKSNKFREEEKNRDEERRKRRKLEGRMLEDRLIVCEEKAKKARKAPQK
jgi:hypothetical protein